MTVARLYVSSQALAAGRLSLAGGEHHHLSRVLRMRKGQEVQVLDGRGMVGRGAIVEMTSSHTVIAVEEIRRVGEEKPRLHLYQALPRMRKMDDVVQWGVELGASSITPFSCQRSLPVPKPASKRMERWRRIALESSRVAGRPYLPVIAPPLPWEDVLDGLRDLGAVLFADEAGGERVSAALGGRRPGELGLLVGPEGGFSDGERGDLAGVGAVPVSLGRTILRTETAGMVLMVAVRCHYGLL